MPHYEYFCHACKTSFSKTLTPVVYGGVVKYARTAAAKKWRGVCQLSTA